MACCTHEVTVDQLLADPLVLAVMRADGLDVGEVGAMLQTTARNIAASQRSQERSVIGQLVGMLAAYYGAALCDCMRPAARFQFCKAM